MKQFFRFFRGELNGFFLNALCTFLNGYCHVTGLLDELVYNAQFQWIMYEEHTTERLAIRSQDIYNIGKIGGLFQPRALADSSIGSIWFTEGQMINGVQRSERGLLDMSYESFMFVRTTQDDYDTDINTLANDERRTTYVERGAVPLGYIREGVDVFEKDGTLIPEHILSAPPQDAAYVEFYGLKYLHFRELFDAELPLDVMTYKMLFEALQRIRRKGTNLAELFNITQVMGEGYIYNLEVVQTNWHYICYYSLDDSKTVYNRARRYAAWLIALRMKFPMFTFFNRVIQET